MKSESLVDQTVDCVQTTFVRDGAKDRYKARDRVGLDKYVNFDEPFDNVVCVHFEHLVMPAKIKPSQTHADVTRGKHKMFTKKQRTQQFTTSACTMFRPGGRNSHVDAVPSCSRPFVELYLSRLCSQQLDGSCQVRSSTPQNIIDPRTLFTAEFQMSDIKADDPFCLVLDCGERDDNLVTT